MKKSILVFVLFTALLSKAQVINNPGFESWSTDTSYFTGFPPYVAADTFSFKDPNGWTSSNYVSGADSLGGRVFVTQDPNHFGTGNFSAKFITDTLLPVNSPLGGAPLHLTVPGFALNGRFPITLNTFIFGGNISPVSIPGAGQPWTKRLAKLRGQFNYTPVTNTFTGVFDTCLIWATLRHGNIVVADAIFKSNSTTGGQFSPFEADFVYSSCLNPDTLVILIGSSIPNFSGILSGTTRLTAGSVLYVDTLAFDTLAANYNYPPIANADTASTNENVVKTVNVLANDMDCDGQPLTAFIVINAHHGSATVSLGQVVYTPNVNYFGMDTIYYRAHDANGNDSAWLIITVVQSTGISEANEIPVSVYPVPANNILNIQFENTGKTTAHIYDMVGNLVLSNVLNNNFNSINIEGLANGFYSIQITDEKNTVIARSKFVITK